MLNFGGWKSARVKVDWTVSHSPDTNEVLMQCDDDTWKGTFLVNSLEFSSTQQVGEIEYLLKAYVYQGHMH